MLEDTAPAAPEKPPPDIVADLEGPAESPGEVGREPAPEGGQPPSSRPAVVVCSRCGMANKPWERFCRSCSAFLEWSGRPVEAGTAVHVPVEDEPTDVGPTRLLERARDWALYGPHRAEPAPLPPAMAPGADQVDWSRIDTEEEQAPVEDQPGVVRPDQEIPVTPVIGAHRPVAESDEADLGCRACGAGNSASRHFCRRCGATLATPPPPVRLSRWQRWRARRHQRHESHHLLELGGRPKQKRQAFGGIRGGWISNILAKIFLGLAILVAVGAMAGPYANTLRRWFTARYDWARDTVDAQYDPIYPVKAEATSALPGHPALDVIDGKTNNYWAAAGPAVGQAINVYFGQPENISQVGFLIGIQGADYLNQPRPQVVHLTFNDGISTNESLVDTQNFQSFKVDAPKTTQMQVLIESVYQSAVGDNVAITQIEFRTKR